MVKNSIKQKINSRRSQDVSIREQGNASVGEMAVIMFIAIVIGVFLSIMFSTSSIVQVRDFKDLPQDISQTIIKEASSNPTFTGFGSDNAEIDISAQISTKNVDKMCSNWAVKETEESVTFNTEKCKISVTGDWKKFTVTGKIGSNAKVISSYVATIDGGYVPQ
jgi:hypothetical protein